MGIEVFSDKDGSLDLVYHQEFTRRRQVQIFPTLEPGKYVIVPRSSACTMDRPPAKEGP